MKELMQLDKTFINKLFKMQATGIFDKEKEKDPDESNLSILLRMMEKEAVTHYNMPLDEIKKIKYFN